MVALLAHDAGNDPPGHEECQETGDSQTTKPLLSNGVFRRAVVSVVLALTMSQKLQEHFNHKEHSQREMFKHAEQLDRVFQHAFENRHSPLNGISPGQLLFGSSQSGLP